MSRWEDSHERACLEKIWAEFVWGAEILPLTEERRPGWRGKGGYMGVTWCLEVQILGDYLNELPVGLIHLVGDRRSVSDKLPDGVHVVVGDKQQVFRPRTKVDLIFESHDHQLIKLKVKQFIQVLTNNFHKLYKKQKLQVKDLK